MVLRGSITDIPKMSSRILQIYCNPAALPWIVSGRIEKFGESANEVKRWRCRVHALDMREPMETIRFDISDANALTEMMRGEPPWFGIKN